MGRSGKQPSAPQNCFLTFRYVAVSIAHFVSSEMRSIDAPGGIRFFATLRIWPLIAMVRMEMVIYMAPEFFRAMEPRANANEDAVVEPFWAVVANRSAVIRRDVIVAVGAVRSRSNLDSHLSLCTRGGSRDADYCKSS